MSCPANKGHEAAMLAGPPIICELCIGISQEQLRLIGMHPALQLYCRLRCLSPTIISRALQTGRKHAVLA